jgi:uncharacterized protein YkwD
MSDYSPAAVAPRTVEARRLIALAVALVLALTALMTPREAHAATRPRLTTTTTSNYAKAMLVLLNEERHAHHLRPLAMNWRLRLSAHRHNLRMAKADEMSHQLPNEPFFATRISNAGYRWSYAAENVGVTPQPSKAGVLALERMMYNEAPPNDTAHRQNILSRRARQVGIDVYYDAKHHRIWFTQDFGAPS